MTQEEKQLLLKDLCARLPYGVKCAIFDDTLPFGGAHGKYPFEMDGVTIEEDEIDVWLEKGNFNLGTIKPYLRPMSSMTEEEEKEIRKINHCFYKNGYIDAGVFAADDCGCTVWEMSEILNYLNAHHFAYRGLIDKELAIEAPVDMYKTE